MAVDSTHGEYDTRAPQWRKLRCVNEGEDAVKAVGPAYLPKLGGQDDDQYRAYVMRASFYNATSRTLESLSGMLFRKPPQIEAPTTLDSFLEDVTLSGVPFQGFAEQVAEDVLLLGRIGALVEYPRVEQRGLTKEAASRMNLRPFFICYPAEDILDWRVGLVGNKTTLLQIRLWEVVEEPHEEDEFESDSIEQVRVLELAPETYQYQQRVFRKDQNDQWYQHGDTIVPVRNGQPLNEIPFVFFGVNGTRPQVSKPPLLDLANVNLSHYRTSADLEHGAHFTALPTPYCFGIAEAEQPEAIGPEALWVSSSSEVKAGMLEFEGTGLQALERRLEVKEGQMASLGARLLEAPKRAAEAADTARTHRAGEMSVLASVAAAVSAGLTDLLRIAGEWLVGGAVEVEVRLNTDFLPAQANPQLLTAIMQGVQAGRVSQKTLFEHLRQSELLAPGVTFEEDELDRANDGLVQMESDEEEENDPPENFGNDDAGGAGEN